MTSKAFELVCFGVEIVVLLLPNCIQDISFLIYSRLLMYLICILYFYSFYDQISQYLSCIASTISTISHTANIAIPIEITVRFTHLLILQELYFSKIYLCHFFGIHTFGIVGLSVNTYLVSFTGLLIDFILGFRSSLSL